MAYHNWHTIYCALASYKEVIKDLRAKDRSNNQDVRHYDQTINDIQTALDGAWAEITVGEDDE